MTEKISGDDIIISDKFFSKNILDDPDMRYYMSDADIRKLRVDFVSFQLYMSVPMLYSQRMLLVRNASTGRNN